MSPPSSNFLTLHRDHGRHRFFSESTGRPPFFDPLTKSWIISDRDQCRELVASNKLRPDSYSENYTVLGKRLGIDFSALAFAMDQVPFCLHGEPHLRARRVLSEFLAMRKPALSGHLSRSAKTHFAALRHEGRVELMRQVVTPFVVDILSTMIGIDISPVGEAAPLLFDRAVGVGKRRRITADVAAARDMITAHLGEGASDEEVGKRLALVLVGRNALIGTFGESLHAVFAANPGRRLDQIDYPQLPPQTGVAIIERIVIEPFTVAHCDFKAGDRIRLMLQTFAYAGDDKTRALFFGTGTHVCIGRPLTVDSWKAITAELSTIPLRVDVTSYAMQDSDYVFACPKHLEVALCP